MPPRPTPIARPKHNINRLSAVYIGSNPSVAAAHFASSSPLAYTSPTVDGSSIPDLPEPPSPVGSDTGSGLPSPPATNSTGSTDDTQTLEVPERPLSFTSSSGSSTSTGGGHFSPKDLAASGSGLGSMRRGASGTRSLHRSSSSISSVVSSTSRNGRFEEGPSKSTSTSADSDLERVHHNGQGEASPHMTHDEEEGDDTARLDLRRSIAATTDDVLERAKSLTRRNRMTLERLASVPRAGTPKSITSRSPAPSYTSLPESSTSTSSTPRVSGLRGVTSPGTTLGTSSARSTPSSRPLSLPPTHDSNRDLEPVSRSGSETERESISSFSGSHHQRPSSSPSYTRPTASTAFRTDSRTPPPSARRRATSPLNALTAENTSRNAGIGGRHDVYENDMTTTSTTTVSTTTDSNGSGSASGSNSSRVRKRVSLALTTPSRLGHTSVEPGADEEVHSHNQSTTEFGEVDRRASVRARTSLSFTSPAEERRWERERRWDRDRDKERDSVTQSALAAVASSRRGLPNGNGSPYTPEGGSGGRRRGALPAEFVRGDTSINQSPSPMTPYRPTSIVFTSSNSSSASGSTAISHSSTAFSHASGSASGAGTSSRAGSSLGIAPRTSSIRREARQKWASEDYSAASSAPHATRSADDRRYGDPPHSAGLTASMSRRTSTFGSAAVGEPVMGMAEYRERKQSMRGGSAESALASTAGRRRRSLVGEGFRAAGLSGGRAQVAKRFSLGEEEGRVGVGGTVFRRPPDERGAGANGWELDGHGGSHVNDVDEARRMRADTLRARVEEGPRAATSMAQYRYTDGEERGYDHERRHRALRSTHSAFTMSPMRRERDVSLTREREALEVDRSTSSLSRYGALRSHVLRDQQSLERFSSPFGGGKRNQMSSPAIGATPQQLRDQDHVRLLAESLTMFEGQFSRVGGGGIGELVKDAQMVVVASERLNNMLRSGMSRAVEEQVNAEVDDPNERGAEMAELWGRVGMDYRDGLRVSDDLVRGLTAFLLGISKTVRDVATGGNGDLQHGRSISLDEGGLLGGGRRRGTMSPDVFVGASGPGSSGSGSGRRSVESQRSWEPRESLREDVSRRLSARAESALGQERPSSSIGRERKRVEGRFDSPPPADASSRGPGSTGSSQARRVLTSREQRAMTTPVHGNGMRTIHSQEPLEDFEPSPSPVPRLQGQRSSDRDQSLPALAIPKPLPALPSEGILRRNQPYVRASGSNSPALGREKESERRKASVMSIQTIRGGSTSNFPASLTTPSSATTAVTPHTVSTMSADERTVFPPLQRTDSTRSTRSDAVTFSRPSTVSVSALNGLQEKDERRRTESNGSSGAEPSTSVRVKRVTSGSETERDNRRKTVGARAGRLSMDKEVAANQRYSSTVNAADRSAALAARSSVGGTIPPPMNTARRERERRRTVTDIWPKDS